MFIIGQSDMDLHRALRLARMHVAHHVGRHRRLHLHRHGVHSPSLHDQLVDNSFAVGLVTIVYFTIRSFFTFFTPFTPLASSPALSLAA